MQSWTMAGQMCSLNSVVVTNYSFSSKKKIFLSTCVDKEGSFSTEISAGTTLRIKVFFSNFSSIFVMLVRNWIF